MQAKIDDRLNKMTANDPEQAGAYKFNYSETQDLDNFVKSGNLSARNAALAKQMIAESQEENLGYAFLTFSHADEARIFLLKHQLSFFKHVPIEVVLKSKLDHDCMDLKFFLQRARNEAKTYKELEQVRKAR